MNSAADAKDGSLPFQKLLDFTDDLCAPWPAAVLYAQPSDMSPCIVMPSSISHCFASRGLTSTSFCIMSSGWRERTSLCRAFSCARSLSTLQLMPVACGAVYTCQMRSKRAIPILTRQCDSRCMKTHRWQSWRRCPLQPRRADAAWAPDCSQSNSRGSAATNTNNIMCKFCLVLFCDDWLEHAGHRFTLRCV